MSHYSSRSFHRLLPSPLRLADAPSSNHPIADHRFWLGRLPDELPLRNRELGRASRDAHVTFNLSISADDAFRVLFIKAYKVGSTSAAAIFARMAVTRGWRTFRNASDVFADLSSSTYPRPYDAFFNHNFFPNGGSGSRFACKRRPDVGNATMWCGGYQPWMDFAIPRAWRVVMVAEPVERVASMLYYEGRYTRSVGRTVVQRQEQGERFANPLSDQGRNTIGAFLRAYTSRWDRVQWHWLREGTPSRTLEDVLAMLDNGAFLVGIKERFDESLLLWRYFMGLYIEDILYVRLKSTFDHPSVHSWAEADINSARATVEVTGDRKYYERAMAVFDRQVEAYGADALARDLRLFTAVLARLTALCSRTTQPGDAVGVHQRAVCMVAKYRLLGLAAQFNEA